MFRFAYTFHPKTSKTLYIDVFLVISMIKFLITILFLDERPKIK